MLSWWIIGLLVVIVIVILKFKEIRHKFGFLVFLFLMTFLLVTAYNIYKSNEVDLATFDGLVKAGKLYFSWLGSVVSNVKGITGYVVSQPWGVNVTAIG